MLRGLRPRIRAPKRRRMLPGNQGEFNPENLIESVGHVKGCQITRKAAAASEGRAIEMARHLGLRQVTLWLLRSSFARGGLFLQWRGSGRTCGARSSEGLEQFQHGIEVFR